MRERVNIGKYKIEVEHEWVDPRRPTLVFLHQGLGCVELWRDFPAAVAEAARCNRLAYSRLGYGQSDPASLPRPVSYLEDEALGMLPAVLSHYAIDEHILIGHSDGGSIALVYAGHWRPPKLLGVITEAAHVFNESITVASIEKARRAYLHTGLREKLAQYHRDVDNAFWGWSDVWLHADFVDWNIESYLPAIEAPLLILQGQDDQYGTVAQVEAIRQGAGGLVQTCVIPECRHAPHEEQRDLTLAKMVDFIAQLGCK